MTVQSNTSKEPQIHGIAFTDGSCLGSPGPVGAGAIIFPSNNQPQIEISKAVSKKGSILLGELIAIKLVVDHFLISENRQNTDSITQFTDSQTSIGILTLNWKSENYIKVIREIKNNMKVLKMYGIPLNFEWTPGHADIQGNDIADSLTKKGAKEAEKIKEPSEVTRQDIKHAARESVFKKMAEPMGIKSTWQKLL
ncbi:ribonuclease H-like [Mytilus trossulus]|uniref:ribonuclease H-like n=1 Tax=Mytilus trossulus TaxID=6551 RepID=UPI003004A7DC